MCTLSERRLCICTRIEERESLRNEWLVHVYL